MSKLPRTEVASTPKVGDVLVYSGDIDVASVFLGRVTTVTSDGATVVGFGIRGYVSATGRMLTATISPKAEIRINRSLILSSTA